MFRGWSLIFTNIWLHSVKLRDSENNNNISTHIDLGQFKMTVQRNRKNNSENSVTRLAVE